MTKTAIRAIDNRRTQCEGKKDYASERAALRDARSIRHMGLRPYLCPHCHRFHLGGNLRHAHSTPYKRENKTTWLKSPE